MQTITNQNRIYRNKVAAEFLGISPATYWRLIRSGVLPQPVKITAQIGGQPQHVLDKFVESRTLGGDE